VRKSVPLRPLQASKHRHPHAAPRSIDRSQEGATLLTGTNWQYTKVPQAEFNKLQPSDLSDVTTAFTLSLGSNDTLL